MKTKNQTLDQGLSKWGQWPPGDNFSKFGVINSKGVKGGKQF